MATTLTNTTFNASFKDDFADSAGFHKILFNSGRAVQARELTQLQTILQTQIARFGDNIFKEGAVCLLYTSPSPRDLSTSRMPSSA